MKKFYFENVSIKKLWGHKQIDLDFHSDLSIIIGPNSSGKTTILNILRFLFSGQIDKLIKVPFGSLVVKLRSFTGNTRMIVEVRVGSDNVHISLDERKAEVPIMVIKDFPREFFYARHRENAHIPKSILEFVKIQQELVELVPAAWLPVSRRLPKPEQSGYGLKEPQSSYESVDERLKELLRELVDYCLKVSIRRSELHREFQKKALLVALYDPKLDKPDFDNIALPTSEDQNDLKGAFQSIEFWDKDVSKRIDRHFREARSAVEAIIRFVRGTEGPVRPFLYDALVLPSHLRALQMVELSRKLTHDERELNWAIGRFEELVNSFISNKKIRIGPNGQLNVRVMDPKSEEIDVEALSSGEKQVLILLTQAITIRDTPSVYVVDEPELSLHISWQQSLLSSIRELAGPVQIITTTHSPDIIGPYEDKIIKLKAL